MNETKVKRPYTTAQEERISETQLNLLLPKTMREFIVVESMRRKVSMSEYIRQLVRAQMATVETARQIDGGEK